MWNIFKLNNKDKERKQYQKIRIDAQEALKSGDRRKYFALNAIADRMIDRIITF